MQLGNLDAVIPAPPSGLAWLTATPHTTAPPRAPKIQRPAVVLTQPASTASAAAASPAAALSSWRPRCCRRPAAPARCAARPRPRASSPTEYPPHTELRMRPVCGCVCVCVCGGGGGAAGRGCGEKDGWAGGGGLAAGASRALATCAGLQLSVRRPPQACAPAPQQQNHTPRQPPPHAGPPPNASRMRAPSSAAAAGCVPRVRRLPRAPFTTSPLANFSSNSFHTAAWRRCTAACAWWCGRAASRR